VKHPLNINNFSILDRIKLAFYLLNPKNFWTISNQTLAFEKEIAEFVGSNYAVYVSSGSTANTLLAMYVKDFFFNKTRNQIILPSTTWQTSCSPWIREGFKPVFLDISLKDFSMDLDSLSSYLKENNKKVSCVFITSLIGFTPNIDRIKSLQKTYPDIYFALDNCENTLSSYKLKNVSSYFTSTTSTEEYELFCSYRNHGMVRGRSKEFISKYKNNDVDEKFDFCVLGNNFRNTDINAFLGRLDLKKAQEYIQSRRKLSHAFYSNLNKKYSKYVNYKTEDVPFCLPIICDSIEEKNKLLNYCKENEIETRPIISGNLLRQSCYKKYGKYKDYKNSEILHQRGFYIGLYFGLQEEYLLKLAKDMNNLYENS
jgi:CDP-6-deoxy-D-xylo-4-hexulose-3-dehydrase